jgi:hypothetical protein
MVQPGRRESSEEKLLKLAVADSEQRLLLLDLPILSDCLLAAIEKVRSLFDRLSCSKDFAYPSKPDRHVPFRVLPRSRETETILISKLPVFELPSLLPVLHLAGSLSRQWESARDFAESVNAGITVRAYESYRADFRQ